MELGSSSGGRCKIPQKWEAARTAGKRELLAIYGLDLAGSVVAEHSGCDIKKRIVWTNGEVRHIRCVGVLLWTVKS